MVTYCFDPKTKALNKNIVSIVGPMCLLKKVQISNTEEEYKNQKNNHNKKIKKTKQKKQQKPLPFFPPYPTNIKTQ